MRLLFPYGRQKAVVEETKGGSRHYGPWTCEVPADVFMAMYLYMNPNSLYKKERKKSCSSKIVDASISPSEGISISHVKGLSNPSSTLYTVPNLFGYTIPPNLSIMDININPRLYVWKVELGYMIRTASRGHLR